MKNFHMAENSRALNFPLSPLGDVSKLNKYLEHVYLLGDPHLGRKFKTGVPVDRRGEREAMQMQQFQDEIMGLKPGRKLHVCMGDLFDQFTVDNKYVEFAYQTYKQASKWHPDVTFIVLQGNHDASRDSTKVSSFQIFAELCRDLKNVKVLTDHVEFITVFGLNFLFVPWVPFKTASELLELEFALWNKAKNSPFVAFGHWDTKSYGQEVAENVIPWDHFTKDCCEGVVTGHEHKRTRTFDQGIEIFVTGSMQPYAHGEESDNEPEPMYLTHTRGEVLANLEQDLDYYKNKVLRVALDDNELPLSDIACLQLTNKKAKQINDDADIEVKVDEFSLEAIFKTVMAEKNVSLELTQELWSKL